MTANLREEHREGIWSTVPEGAVPPGLELRRAFLLRRLRGLASATPGTALRVLDAGCGEGQLTAAIASCGCEAVGVDVAAEPLRRARARHPGLELLRIAEDREWPLPDASFDVVWAGETIEHVADTGGWLSEVRRVLRSGGTLLLSTPAHGPLTRLALALSPARFERHFDPRADHLRFYTARSLAQLLADFRFERIETREEGGLPGARRTLLAAAVRARF
jgi:SAM-dependent methyltransferase